MDGRKKSGSGTSFTDLFGSKDSPVSSPSSSSGIFGSIFPPPAKTPGRESLLRPGVVERRLDSASTAWNTKSSPPGEGGQVKGGKNSSNNPGKERGGMSNNPGRELGGTSTNPGRERGGTSTNPGKERGGTSTNPGRERGGSAYVPGQEGRSHQPCHLSSSIYYGGQDFYSRPQSSPSHPVFSNDAVGDEHYATRGNWWQGSLYY